MKYRILFNGCSYRPQYKYKYWPVWFDLIRCYSLEHAREWIRNDIRKREHPELYKPTEIIYNYP